MNHPSISIVLCFSFINYFSPISAMNPNFTSCNKTITCGNLTNIAYPFYDGETRPEYCGYPGFKLLCKNTTPQINITNRIYNLLSIKTTKNLITVSMNDFNSTNACPGSLRSTSIDPQLFKFSSNDQNLTFYACTQTITGLLFPTECENLRPRFASAYYMTAMMSARINLRDISRVCQWIPFPILNSAAKKIDEIRNTAALVDAFKAGFELGYFAGETESSCIYCIRSGGACGFNLTSHNFVCYSLDFNSNHTSPNTGTVKTPPSGNGTLKPTSEKQQQQQQHTKAKLKIILYSVFSGLLLILLAIIIIHRKKVTNKGLSTFLSRDKFTEENKNVEIVLKSHAALIPKRCSYSDLKKMTNSFVEKLGEGGFGGVYKGKLLDGRLVAVKLLKGSNGNGEGFINEVASIGTTNHVNIVKLLGFCFERSKRALVYEYMPNGSLEKFMHGEAYNGHSSLTCETLFQIVLGIARGLEYLHRGCQTRILHFDIKPHNILLDDEFRPKISDFGLAKLTPQDKQSKVSMSGTRGTVGYIAPEVFCRSFGDVSHKSDVYSYGMMVLEVMGSRKREVAHQVESSGEQYFPNWIYKQLEQGEEVEVDISMNNNDKDLKRKMTVISLWCIQPVPSSRPPMSRVVQMLQGSVESIEIPPMPLHLSPPRLQWDPSMSSTTSFPIPT